MTKTSQHPWPTDGVTKKQLDRALDRQERLYKSLKERIVKLEEFLGR